MKYMKRRGLRMFAVAALLPMMAMAQAKPAVSQQDPGAVQQVTQRVLDFLSNVPKMIPGFSRISLPMT